MKSRWLFLVLFVISFCSLLISLALFWNQGIFADDYNLSPELICGGGFWNGMDWLRLVFLFLLCLLSGDGTVSKRKNY
ncbi:hypothetical protein A7X67_00515 [Clostridium sp. W14A]|nr:hypothetical protein A7X67_00515 [Clostridium sp. W14A]